MMAGSPRQRALTAQALEFDVCIVGGGPAGAVAAALLAGWGHSVLMVHFEPRQSELAESLPGSTRKLVGFLGLL
jgi:2-polyprenyl-6-methoxyphenol hydroxylase-like FAD-dependent oxidoreductase